MEREDLSSSCTNLVGEPLRRTLNRYITAENQWTKCIRNIKCNDKKNTNKLQNHWAIATSLLENLDEVVS